MRSVMRMHKLPNDALFANKRAIVLKCDMPVESNKPEHHTRL